MENNNASEHFDLHTLIESVAFGVTDGVICFLGLIVGVARATSDPKMVIIAATIGGVADALGNSIGFFVSQATERAVQIQQNDSHVHSKREVWMSGVCSFLATILTLVLMVSPFIFLSLWTATTVSFIIGTVMSLILGSYIGKLSKENPYKSAIRYASITIAGAVLSYAIGEFLRIYLML